MFKRLVIPLLLLIAGPFGTAQAGGQCPDYLNQSFQKLRSPKTLNICEAYAGKPLLIVNTASHCGYTPQFSGLQKLYEQYKDKGLVVLGFPSDDFFQESSDDKEIANICFINYGVKFDMFAPIKVTGDNAHPLFKALAAQAKQPSWNFNKYLLNGEGRVVKYFGSQVTPDSDEMKQALEGLLGR